MNKKLIASTVAALMFGAVSVANAEVNLSGFIDTVLVVSDEAADNTGNDKDAAGVENATEMKYNTNGEIDLSSTMGDVSVRVDLDVMDSGSDIEQAFASWNLGGATLMIGSFNNPMGLEKEDAPDMLMTSHGQLWDVLDGATTQSGNNVEGIAVSFGAGPANITVGLLEEITGLVDGENSMLLNIGGTVVDGVDVELGFLTMADNGALVTTSAETVTNLNATWQINDMFWAAFEYAAYGKVLDTGMTVAAGADFGSGFGGVIRMDSISYENTATQDTDSTAIALTYGAADNLNFVFEFRNDDNGNACATCDHDTVTLEAIGTF